MADYSTAAMSWPKADPAIEVTESHANLSDKGCNPINRGESSVSHVLTRTTALGTGLAITNDRSRAG